MKCANFLKSGKSLLNVLCTKKPKLKALSLKAKQFNIPRNEFISQYEMAICNAA